MGTINWSEEQKQAIYEEGKNILVAAAAGSGKTAVLVERIITKIISKKMDIDKLLIVTFTNAAAAEMKERILDAIYKRLDENPEDEHLQRQIMLLSKSNICTIDSFCLDVVKNNFYEIDITPNFRIADQAEIELIKQEVIEDLFEKKYIEKNEDFLELINTYTGYRGDEPLKNLVLEIYKYIQSNPYPEEWLEENIKKFNVKQEIETNEDFAKSIWGKILLENIKENIKDCIYGTKNIIAMLKKYDELDKFYKVICTDLDKFEELEKSLDSWDLSFKMIRNFTFDKWPVDKKISLEAKEIAKAKRDQIKKRFTIIKERMLIYNSNEAYCDIYDMYKILNKLKDLVLEFSKDFSKRKKTKNIIDFNDMEHFALDILTKKNESGEYVGTEVAEQYRDKFDEIAIDEYQDSNLVQEQILTTISKGNNIFMVGDVKQSIYKFRQACPKLFLDKYEKYNFKDNFKKEDSGLKIQLFKNFRSRSNILDITNLVFQNIMSKKLGDIEYERDEYLNLGAQYKESKEDLTTDLHIIDLKQKEDEEESYKEDELDRTENTILEAKFVASEIKRFLESDSVVWDKKEECYRKVRPSDISILLRSTSILSPIYEKELSDLEIPVFSDASQEYLNSLEIQVIISVLKIIDNPMQDIPLITVLRSMIGGFTDNELVEIRLSDRKATFYESMKKYAETIEDTNEKIKSKIEVFFNFIKEWRKAQEYLPLNELIWKIYIDSGYYNYVSLLPNGLIRQANLKILFERAKQYEKASFRGIFNFINFIERLKSSSGDLSAAKLISENEDVVRIMSIHKSKGLEFPVVFLCGTGKGINLQDLNNNILLHQELGLGPKYVNYERKIEYNTLAKEAIKCMLRQESISEEMRVLYVALTRAKEKLVITGFSKDIEKALKEKEEILNFYGISENNKIDSNVISKYTSYLDWLELIHLYNKENEENSNKMNLFIHEKQDLLKSIKEQKQTEIEERFDFDKTENKSESDKKRIEEIKKILNWNYKYMNSVNMPTKTSVSKIKEKAGTLEKMQSQINLQTQPEFIKGTQEITPAQKGTLMHLCLQKLDKQEEYNIDKIKEFIEILIQSEKITEEEAKVIDITEILEFTKSKIWQELKTAKVEFKEKPFYINVFSKEIYEEGNEEDKILVQGIIDLYYINKNDELVLVDYKTDKVKTEEELIEKYQVQLKLYKRALEKSLKRKVDRVYIYSMALNKEIEV